ncbi:hypothetical protein WV31_12915 [Magnetospirillum sp. ME-1]|uniref:WbuC family cupin fold metalloprotein n=1 Tax=Magnetospirillum sp. ME-1 TaxID=1639348 RepID=UPI000A17F8E9|nr:WbuC family cupin fold metalloprotein [Magnetospirillum sp. ME-1]ARJ66505.1 hypothetical protein WV31_12915 [Magnetospirillum sp. ME-1]
MIPHKRVSAEVVYSTVAVTKVDRAAIAWLKELAMENPRKRVRLCAHADTSDILHEMLIVHAKGAYVRPHRHPGKSESFHLIEGSLSVFILDEDGVVTERIDMAADDPAKPFFYRLSQPLYHTVVPTSDLVVFHETTNGPFHREETIFGPWSPTDDAPAQECDAFIIKLMGEAW